MTQTAERDRKRRQRGSRSASGAWIATVVGVVLVLAGLSCLGYVGYQLWGTNLGAHRAYAHERQQLKQSWKHQDSATHPKGSKHKGDPKTSATVPGDAIALISIPSIGVDQVPVLQGTSLSVLARGVGHYRNTAGPGQVGNFAVAGHRITHGEPFANLLKMNKGDKIIIETRTKIFTYQLDEPPRNLTVEDTEGWVIEPVPHHPKQQPTQKLITLTTCQDLFHSPDRSVGFGHLVATRNK